jgi:predicted DNA-binding transcriptional regulator YafY
MLLEEINRLQQIDRLIRLNNTGNAQQFARKLNISRRQVYNIIETLKDIGLEIEYNRHIGSFVYAKPYKINISFEIEELPEHEAINVNGGFILSAGIDKVKTVVFGFSNMLSTTKENR